MTADGRTIRSVRIKIGELLIQGNRAHYELGRLIDQVWREEMWRADAWPAGAYTIWDDWCWDVLGRKERSARQLRANFLNLDAMNPAEDTLARALRLGWSKLSVVLRVAKNEIDLLGWIDKIETNRWKEEKIRAEVAIAMGTGDPQDGEEGENSDPGEPPESSGPVDGSTKRRIKFDLTFNDAEDLRIVTAGIRAVRSRYNPEMGYGEAVALMATSYMATLPRDDEGGVAVELEQILEHIEHTFRTKVEVAGVGGTKRKRSRVTPPEANLEEAALDGF